MRVWTEIGLVNIDATFKRALERSVKNYCTIVCAWGKQPLLFHLRVKGFKDIHMITCSAEKLE